MAIEIRLLEESEIQRANDFFNRIYKTNRSLEDFRWEFVEGPCGKAIYVVALDTTNAQPKIVGIQCAIPLNLMRGSHTILTAKSEDTLVDPDYRGQKIFERMYELLFDACRKAEINFIWGFTPAAKAFDRIGFEIPYQAHQALLVLKPIDAYHHLAALNPINKTLDRVKILGLSFLSYGMRLMSIFKDNTKLTVKQINLGSKNSIITKLMPATNLAFLSMDDDYINWRVTKNPFKNHYENYQIFKNDELLADVMINIRNEVGYVEQFIFNENCAASLRKSVVREVVNLLVLKKVALIRSLCFDINEELLSQEMVLKQAGFILLKRGAHFVWKSLAPTQLDPTSLFLTRMFTQGNQ